ncbi:metal-dependent transcriptional regulator, partial [Bacteroidota bacterium]
IFSIQRDRGQKVSTSIISSKLSISNAAASEMMKILHKEGYLIHEKYRGVELTQKGKKLALSIIRRHRLWELFLIKTLGLSWSQVHDEAEELEHYTSDNLLEQIERFLKYPKFDPHGDPIPNSSGEMPKIPSLISLKDGMEGKRYRIARVIHDSRELMEYLTELGIRINIIVEVEKKLSVDNSIYIKMNNKSYYISEKVSNNIFVEAIA